MCSRRPAGVVLFAPMLALGRDVGAALAARWHTELIEPTLVLREAVLDARRTLRLQQRRLKTVMPHAYKESVSFSSFSDLFSLVPPLLFISPCAIYHSGDCGCAAD